MSKLNALKDRIIRFKNDVQEQISQRSAQRFATAVNEAREPSPFRSTGMDDRLDQHYTPMQINRGLERLQRDLDEYGARPAQRDCNSDDVAGDVMKINSRVPDYDSAA